MGSLIQIIIFFIKELQSYYKMESIELTDVLGECDIADNTILFLPTGILEEIFMRVENALDYRVTNARLHKILTSDRFFKKFASIRRLENSFGTYLIIDGKKVRWNYYHMKYTCVPTTDWNQPDPSYVMVVLYQYGKPIKEYRVEPDAQIETLLSTFDYGDRTWTQIDNIYRSGEWTYTHHPLYTTWSRRLEPAHEYRFVTYTKEENSDCFVDEDGVETTDLPFIEEPRVFERLMNICVMEAITHNLTALEFDATRLVMPVEGHRISW